MSIKCFFLILIERGEYEEGGRKWDLNLCLRIDISWGMGIMGNPMP
jgi:hypothetical protein